ncbi:anti-sigma factor [Actinomadura montaniterrae]|uniref:Regulator of SigK n=1 Tax=Actinomadura montaniterrae TaxID=1803903 RepID=A0A6L3W662_9ACTN|nr:anti-sigma factor [Actinomadura montaniterrae]KAB2390358.1 anti-sigma factor [Actinomadura montaniterrae]
MTHDPHDLAGPYALDALTAPERRRFERHLRACASCAGETAGLRETTARLALAVSRRPPDPLRARVMRKVARTRQAPPPLARRLPSPRTAGLAWLAAAACLVLALAADGEAWRSHRSAEHAQALNHQVSTVMAAPDAHTSTVRAQGSASVTVVASRSLGKAVVTTSGLLRLPSAKTYQMWWLGPAAPRSAGTPDLTGKARPVVTTGLGDAQRLGVTIEPAGGSPQPTSAPILTVALG